MNSNCLNIYLFIIVVVFTHFFKDRNRKWTLMWINENIFIYFKVITSIPFLMEKTLI